MLSSCQSVRSSVRPSVRPSVRQFVRYRTCVCEHDILKANESISTQIGTSGLRNKDMKESTFEARRSKG